MNLFEALEKAEKDLFDHVGFGNDSWQVFPIENDTEYFWKINENQDTVLFSSSKDDIDDDGNSQYSAEIYQSRHFKKWVYRGEKYTMIIIDTNTDGNKFFAFFDNEREVK